MPRRKAVNLIRDIGVDARFDSEVIQKFINVLMERGKKTVAQRIVYDALDVLVAKSGGDDKKGYALFQKALLNIRPTVEVRPRRVGGSVYQVPTEVRASRAQALSLRWVIGAAAARSEKDMGKRLAAELLEAAEGRGSAFKKKVDVHRMAEANRAFSHFAW